MFQYAVTTPANSTATIQFSMLSGKKVYVNNKEIAGNKPVQISLGTYSYLIK